MARRAWHGVRLAVAVAALVVLVAGTSRGATSRYAPGQLIVKYAAETTHGERDDLRRRLGAKRLRSFDFIRAELLESPGADPTAAIAIAGQLPGVEYAEANALVHVAVQPDDPQYPLLWGLRTVRADMAWNVFRGSPDVRVGVLDTGIDVDHPDLAANIWTNPGEIPGNHLDDDANGYTDDVHGFDALVPDGDPDDDHGHGTHVAGTLAAIGNNGLGVAGVGWRASLVPIKFLSSTGSGTIAGAIAGLEYAMRVGVALTNNSWSGGLYSQALFDAIEAAGLQGQLFVAAAGNSASDNDATPVYPASYESPYVLAVAATGAGDELAGFSNFGAASVDVAAPGVDILSCMPGGGYQVLSGTSMATPHVAGLAALLYGFVPGIDNLGVKARILQSAVPLASLAGRCVTGARLDAFAALAEPDSVAPGTIQDLAVSAAGSTRLVLSWTATGDDGVAGRASTYDVRISPSPIDASNFGAASSVGSRDPGPAGAPESLEVTGLDYETTYYVALRALDEWERAGAISNLAVGTTSGIPAIAADVESLFVVLQAPATATRVVTLSNPGSGDLDWSIAAPEFVAAAPKPVREFEPALVLPKGAPDPRSGDPVLAGSGGPDLFGHRWIDSDEIGGPSFDWIDITSLGTLVPLTGDDQTILGIPLGFAFPFFDQTFTAVNVTSNGFLSFTHTGNLYLNQPLPNRGASVPANLVAPFWDDLDCSIPGARVYAYADGARFVVEYNDVPRYGSTDRFTFEVILDPSGEIRFQYLDLGASTWSATIGIQDWTRTVGLQVAFNTFYLHEGLAIRIHAIPPWLRVTSAASGRLLPGAADQVQLRIDPVGLPTGVHRARLLVLSNDPDTNPLIVPVALDVTAVSDPGELSGAPRALELRLAGPHPAAGRVVFDLAVPHREDVELRVFDVRGALVRRIFHGTLEPGRHQVEWDRRDAGGRGVASGTYFLRLRAGRDSNSSKIVLTRGAP